MHAISSPRFQWDSLFKHQIEARDNTLAFLAKNDRTQVIMACGTGKSRIGPAVAEKTQPLSVVTYLPSLALVRQMLPEWINSDFGRPVSFLCVCSDETVKGDATVVTPDEIRQEFGLTANSVTTDSSVVSSFLLAPSSALRVVFCTYQSSDTLSAGIPEGFKFDLGIFDEAHRTAGKCGMFTGPLQDTHTPIAKRVFMTATPKHVSLRKKNADGEGQTVFSMDDEAVYGQVAYRLPLRQAIDQKLIADYKVLVSVVDDSMLPENWRQMIASGKADVRETEALAHAIALRNAMDKYGLQKIVTFHDSVADARSFASDSFIQNELGTKVAISHINGSMSSGVRGGVMEGFASANQSVITNARCLTEGVDVPEIDLVAFLHPRKSHIDIIQAIGRALRLSRSGRKTTGYVLLPLYVSQIENGGLGAALEESGYDTIYQVIQALREQDETIDTYLREAVWRSPEDKEEEVNLPFVEFSGNPLHLDLLRQSISVHCLDTLVESWETYYGALKRLYADKKKVNVRQDAEIDGLKVGRWCSTQRTSYKTGKISVDRIAKLEAIGFIWDLHESSWEVHFDILERLHAEGKDVNVSGDTEIDGLKVGQWCSNHRANHKAGKLSAEKVARLETVGFAWNLIEASWVRCYAILKRLHAEGQNINVPKSTEIDGLAIGLWCRTQRIQKRACALSVDRIAKLEAIGFIWNLRESSWEAYFDILERLHAEGKDVNVSGDTEIDGLKVGQWTQDQRKSMKSSKLSVDRVAKLEAIGFIWDLLESSWGVHFDILERLHAEGKDVNVSGDTEIDGLKVGQWTQDQRKRMKSSKLSVDRIAKLESIGFIWDLLESSWEAHFGILKRLHAEGKDANVSTLAEINELKVGSWCSNQRERQKAGKLSVDRIAKLESIGFKWSCR